MDNMQRRKNSTRVFGKSITNQSSNLAGHLAGAETSNVKLNEVHKKRGSTEVPTNEKKKIKGSNVEDQENSLPKGVIDQGLKGGLKKVSHEKDFKGNDIAREVRGLSVSSTTSSGVSTAGQCLLNLELNDEDEKRATRSTSKPGILGHILNVASQLATGSQPTPAARTVKPTTSQVVAGPLKPARRTNPPVPVIGTPFKDLLLIRGDVDFTDPSTYYQAPFGLPEDIDDFDKTQVADASSEPHYADCVFKYYKYLESKHMVTDYMASQKNVTKAMRSVLVDWMVEVQESFELNHETLYLGVKLVDNYLAKEVIAKEKFQLLGATCLFIAAKFDERIPPSIEDFLYICDDAYLRKDLINFEMEVLKKLNFFVGFAISYRFLRRFARVAKLTMEQLTLARFILEMSLMDYDVTCTEKDSKVAAAALLLALRMKGMVWTKKLEFYSGYEEFDLITLMNKLNELISFPIKSNKTVRQKYSHKIFFEVAKIPPLPTLINLN